MKEKDLAKMVAEIQAAKDKVEKLKDELEKAIEAQNDVIKKYRNVIRELLPEEITHNRSRRRLTEKERLEKSRKYYETRIANYEKKSKDTKHLQSKLEEIKRKLLQLN